MPGTHNKPMMTHGNKPKSAGLKALAKKNPELEYVGKAKMMDIRAKMAMPKMVDSSNFPKMAQEMAMAMDYNSSKPMMIPGEDEKAASRKRGKEAAMKAQAEKDKAAGTHTGKKVKVRRSDGSVIEVDSRGQIAKEAAKSGNIIKQIFMPAKRPTWKDSKYADAKGKF